MRGRSRAFSIVVAFFGVVLMLTVPTGTASAATDPEPVADPTICQSELPLAPSVSLDCSNPDELVLTDPAPALVDLGGIEPVTFAGRPLTVTSFFPEPVPRLFLTIRDRSGSTVAAVLPVEAGAANQPSAAELTVDLPVGRYRAWPCVGFYLESCVEQPGGLPFQIIDPTPRQLFRGHNRPTAQRINVLFVGSGVGGDRLAAVARRILTKDGPVDVGYDLRYGPLAIEPLASNLDKFNFWYLEDELGWELALSSEESTAGLGEAFSGIELENLQVTALYTDADGPSDSRTTSFFGRLTVPSADQMRFGGVRVSIDLDDPLRKSTTLAHEWGHALFELRDEYGERDERETVIAYPNCAPDRTTAEAWWGDDIGRVDPFVYEVIRARIDAGLPAETYDQPMTELVRIDFVPGGCYGRRGDAVRPSADSLMNSELPVFGAVNRSRVEAVLAEFSGRGPIADPDDLVLSCTSRNGVMTCEGVLRTYLDPPTDGIELSRSPCQFDEATSSGRVVPVAISCSGPAPDGDYATVSIGTARSRVSVINLDPEPTNDDPVADQEVLELATSSTLPGGEEAEQGSMGRFWSVLSASVAGTALLLWRARAA